MSWKVGLNDCKVVFSEEFKNGWEVHVVHSLNGFGHIYSDDKPYSVAVSKPSDDFSEYFTVGTAEEVIAAIDEVRGYGEED